MTTPPLSLSSNDDLQKDEEEPLDIFSMPIPDAPFISRQVTDKEQNPCNSSIPIIDNSINIYSNNSNLNSLNIDSDNSDNNPCAIPSLTNLSAGLLIRQKTDDTPHNKTADGNTVNDNEQKISLPPSTLSRQLTDDTPHSKNQSDSKNTTFNMPETHDNTVKVLEQTHLTETLFNNFNLPPMKITRQLTDDAKPVIKPDIEKQITDIAQNVSNNDNNDVLDIGDDINIGFNLPPMNITRQTTDDAKDIDSTVHNNDVLDINFNLPPMNITRQMTDDAKDIDSAAVHNNDVLDMNFNLPPMNITRQLTDDARENTKVNVGVDDMDFNLPPMNITRQTTDDAKPEQESELKPDIEQQITDVNVDFNLPPMNITRQTTDDVQPEQESKLKPDIEKPITDVLDTAGIHDVNDNIDFNLPPLNISRQITDDTKPDSGHDDIGNDLDALDMPLQITRQQTDQTDKGNDNNNNNNNKSPLPDMNSLNDLLLTPLVRQQTDKTDKEGDYNYGHGFDNQQIIIEDELNTSQITQQNLETFNENNNNLETSLIGDDIGVPKLDTISRQTTDMATNDINDDDNNNDMMIDQMDVSSMIKEIPSRVNVINDNININNQYLDRDLLMFDEDGKLLSDKNNIEEIEDDSINQFIEHKEPIICMGLNPKTDKQYEIITGGQDENAYIWNIISYDSTISGVQQEEKINNNYYKLNNYHTDTIIDCGYNITGKFIATASMDSTIKIFNCNKNYKLISSFDIGNEISFIKWHPNNNKNNRNILMVGSLDKNIWIYKYNKEKIFENIQILSGHSSKIECGGWTKYNDGINGYSGDADGMIIIWENIINYDMPFNGEKKYIFKPNKRLSTQYHESGINVIDDCICKPLLVSGSCDYSVCLLNYENGKILKKLGKHNDSVECVKFNKLYNIYNYVSSSSLDGYINIWDLNNGKLRNKLAHNNSVIVHEWFNNENNSNLIVSGCLNGMVYVWDSRNGKVVKEFKGHRKDNIIQSIKITQDDKYIVSGCDDSSVRVWKL